MEDSNKTKSQLVEEIIGLRDELAEINGGKLKKQLLINQSFIDNTLTYFVAIDSQGNVILMNKQLRKRLGYLESEVIGRNYLKNFVPAQDKQRLTEVFERLTKTNKYTLNENYILAKNGINYLVEWHGVPIFNDDGDFEYFYGVGIDISEREEAKIEISKSNEKYLNLFETSPLGIILINTKGIISTCNSAFLELSGYSEEEIVDKHIGEIPSLNKRDLPSYLKIFVSIIKGKETFRDIEFKWDRKDGSGRIGLAHLGLLKRDGKITGLQVLVEDITERRNVEHELESSRKTLLASQQIANLGSYEFDISAGVWTSNKILNQIFGIDDEYKRDVEGWISIIHRNWQSDMRDYLLNEVIEKRKRFNKEYKIVLADNGKEKWVHGLGKLEFNQVGEPIKMFGTIQDITERKKAEELNKKQYRLISAQHEIDKAITSSHDLDITLQILLNNTVEHLEADSSVILLLDPLLSKLNIYASVGLEISSTSNDAVITFGDSFAGQVALSQKLLISDFSQEIKSKEFKKLIQDEKFIVYAGVPIIAKGKLLGVLEVYSRKVIETDQSWIRAMKIFADQAAIAIENISIFNDLRRSNLELGLAYDQTMEGWAKTLEIRDVETEGHSQRVTDLAAELAAQMGMTNKEVVNVRRGSLLHDLGKMNIPDEILLKEGPLSDMEWEEMKKHPIYAFDYLSDIKFLKNALNIPRYHHEKFDGTGYPYGLKGDQIPLPARIFAIVDVFDALLSDRPYRKAWPAMKTINHIYEQSGKAFDPKVVEIFLNLSERHFAPEVVKVISKLKR